MKYVDQQNPAQSIVSDNGNEVVDGGNQGTGRNSGVDLDFMKKHGDQGAQQAGDHHSYQERQTDTAGNGESIRKSSSFKKGDVEAYQDDRNGAQEQSVA